MSFHSHRTFQKGSPRFYDWIVIVFCITSLKLLTSVDSLPDPPAMLSGRHDRMERGNGDGPARKKSRTEPSSSYQFPTTLEGFKYKFNEKGQLRHCDTDKPYEFEYKKGDRTYNQKRYEALGKLITHHIYKLLETEAKLQRIEIPTDAREGEPKGFVFASRNALTTRDKLLVLINGAGAVRAGQWARRLIINDCLDSGTQLPYIKKAMQDGYEVLVMNTNENRGPDSRGVSVPIRKSSSPYEHGVYVWDEFISSRPVKHVAIVAHSMGGSVTEHIARKREQSFLRKVFAVAFTDSIHNLGMTGGVSQNVRNFFAKNTVNWVSSSQPLDTPMPGGKRLDSKQVSAGTKVHAETSWTSFKSVFTFLKDKEAELAARQTKQKPSLAHIDDDDEDVTDDESTLELRQESTDDDDSQDKESSREGERPKGRSAAGIDISSSDEDTEASFDFTRYSEEL